MSDTVTSDGFDVSSSSETPEEIQASLDREKEPVQETAPEEKPEETPEEKAAAEMQAKADAAAGEKLDKVLAHLDNLHRRMDSCDEQARKDSEEAEEA